MESVECPNCGQPSESPLCNLACGHTCCVGCSNPVCKCGAPIQIALPILTQPPGTQTFVGKFKALPHPFSPSTFMAYPAKKKQVTPKHLRKRFKRGKKHEEVEEEDVNPDLYKYKVEDPKGNKSNSSSSKKAVFLGQLETSENKMPAIAGAVRRSHYTTVMLVRKNNQFSCVYGDALKTLSFRLAVNYKTLDIDQAEAARKRQFKWTGAEKFAKISDRLTSRPTTGMEAREALLDERPKADIEAKLFAKSTEAETPKVRKNAKKEQPESEESDEEGNEGLDENGKRLESLMKGNKKNKEDKNSGNNNDSDSSDSFDDTKLEDSSSSDSEDAAPPPPPAPKAKRAREEAIKTKAKRPKAATEDQPPPQQLQTQQQPQQPQQQLPPQSQTDMQVESFVRSFLTSQTQVTIRDLAKAVTAHFPKLEKPQIKVLLAPILKNICKYSEVGGVKVLTLADTHA